MSIVKPVLPHVARTRGLWRGLIHAWTLHEGSGLARSLVSQVDGTLTGAGTVWRQSIHGWAVYQPNTTGHRITMPSLPVSDIIPDRFTVVIGFVPGTTGTARPTFGFLGSGTANAALPFGSYNGGINFGNGTTHQLLTALPAAVTSSKTWVNIYAITDDGTNYTVYHNGLQVNQAAITVNPASGTDRQFNIGTSGFSGSVEHPQLGWTLFYYIFNRALSGQELRVLAPDPYSFTRPEKYWAITEAAAGGTTIPVVNLSLDRGNLTRSLSWSATPDTAVYYVDWSPDNSTWTQVARYETTVTQHVDNDIRLGVDSYYRIRATNAAGTGTSNSVFDEAFPQQDAPTDNLIGAFDLRLIRSAYTGDCLRLRRDSDNAESDFGFFGNVLDRAAIATWAGSARTYVVTWYNQDGSTNHATQSDTAKQAEITAAGIVFTGSQWYDVSGIAASFSGIDKPITVAAVIRPNVTADARSIFGLTSTSSANPLIYVGMSAYQSLEQARRNDAGTLVGLSATGNLGVLSTTEFEGGVALIRADRTVANYRSGTMCLFPASYASATITLDQARIGSTSTSLDGVFSFPFSGTMRSVLIYAAGLSSADIRDVSLYQNRDTHYGLMFEPSPYYADNAASYLEIPVYSGATYQAIHPDIYDSGAGNTTDGHRFWMVHTPYPGGDFTVENPSIVVSDANPAVDQVWTVPSGLTNPIAGPPGVGVYGDTHLLRALDDKWYVYWVHTDDGPTKIMESHSSDGITWSSAVELFTAASEGSPIVFHDGTQYVMYTFEVLASPRGWKRRTSSLPDSGWSSATSIAMPAINSMGLWDSNIIYHNGVYHGLLCYSRTNQGIDTLLFYARSENGTDWTVYRNALLNPSPVLNKWDRSQIYRSTALITDWGMHLYYSAFGNSDWHTGYSPVYLLDAPAVVDRVPRPGVLILGGAGMV